MPLLRPYLTSKTPKLRHISLSIVSMALENGLFNPDVVVTSLACLITDHETNIRNSAIRTMQCLADKSLV